MKNGEMTEVEETKMTEDITIEMTESIVTGPQITHVDEEAAPDRKTDITDSFWFLLLSLFTNVILIYLFFYYKYKFRKKFPSLFFVSTH